MHMIGIQVLEGVMVTVERVQADLEVDLGMMVLALADWEATMDSLLQARTQIAGIGFCEL